MTSASGIGERADVMESGTDRFLSGRSVVAGVHRLGGGRLFPILDKDPHDSKLKNDMSELDQYDYRLPRELIAQHPLRKRSDARLMVVHRASGQIEHSHVR